MKELLKVHNTFDFVLYLLTFSATAIFIIDKLFQNESTIQEEKYFVKKVPLSLTGAPAKRRIQVNLQYTFLPSLKGRFFCVNYVITHNCNFDVILIHVILSIKRLLFLKYFTSLCIQFFNLNFIVINLYYFNK